VLRELFVAGLVPGIYLCIGGGVAFLRRAWVLRVEVKDTYIDAGEWV